MVRASAAWIVVVVAASGCAVAQPRLRSMPDVAWPAAPAEPRVRLVDTLPAPPPPPSRWRRFVNAIAGIDAKDARAELQRPFGVAVSEDGEVIVVDPDVGAVYRMRAELTPVTCEGREWSAPLGLAVAADGTIVVADAGAAEIVRIAPDGACSAVGAGELERPTGVAANAERIYVTDAPRHEVVVFSPGKTERLGRRGDAADEFSYPTAAAVAPDGTILVVDALNFRIVRLTREGAWVSSFGAAGEEGGAFARPKGIAVDRAGRIYVSDAQRDLVLVFRADGSFEYAIGGTGTEPGWFTHPAGVAVAAGRLYVADSHNRRIQVFEILGERS